MRCLKGLLLALTAVAGIGIAIVALFTLFTGLHFAQSNWKALRLGTEL